MNDPFLSVPPTIPRSFFRKKEKKQAEASHPACVAIFSASLIASCLCSCNASCGASTTRGTRRPALPAMASTSLSAPWSSRAMAWRRADSACFSQTKWSELEFFQTFSWILTWIYHDLPHDSWDLKGNQTWILFSSEADCFWADLRNFSTVIGFAVFFGFWVKVWWRQKIECKETPARNPLLDVVSGLGEW